ncbi:hypothetical protein LTR95_005101 [Oleoguttula sp. CCFEE 5521]
MLWLQVALVAAVAAAAPAPAEKRWGGDHGGHWWATPSQTSDYIDFGKRWRSRDAVNGVCDLSKAQMPVAPTPLPSPAAGLVLSHVALGRGTQNYTCDLSNSTAVPVAAGALATLFNVSCIAADLPDLLSKLSPIALDLPIPSSSDTSSPVYNSMSGRHYFTDLTTAFFNLDTELHPSWGQGSFKKANSSAAPADATKGQFGKGDGTVPWLKLNAKMGAVNQYQEVYRLNTAGGQPPKTCKGAAASFEVQYSAEYWLYK